MDFILGLPSSISLGLIWGILAIGLFISYKVLDISDLTVDGSICTGAVICTILMINGVSPLVAIIVSFIGGAICGIITGLFHTLLGIPAILSGILTQLMLWSINIKILGKANMSLSSISNLLIESSSDLKSILILLVFIVIIIGFLYWFFGTEIGCSIRATGNNEKMSRANGLNTGLIKIVGLGLSNGFVALSGALLCQYQGFADINMGRGAIVIGLASIIIGTSITKLISKNFAFTLFGCALGSIIYYIVYQLVIFIGIDTDLLKMLSAIVVAIFLGIPYLRNKHKLHHKNKEVKPC